MNSRRRVNSTVMFLFYQNKIAVLLLLFVLCGSAYSQKRRLTQSQAVKAAEQFIARNGYTDLPPDRTKLSYETIEWESDVNRMLEDRHDELERHAYGVTRGGKGRAGWTVVFRYRHPADREERKLGRAVTMNLDGSDMRVEHVDFILRYAKRLR
jgi:hypothetical protein